MPAYFFHLRIELRPRHHPHHSSLGEGDQDRYVPPAGTDIFKGRLPSHPYSSDPERELDRATGLGETSLGGGKYDRLKSSPRGYLDSCRRAQQSEGLQLAHISTKEYPTSSTIDSVAPSSDSGGSSAPDNRIDLISIESIDMSLEPRRAADHSNDKSASDINNGLGTGPAGFAAKGRFVPLDPKKTELGWGIVHLYRDAVETPGLYDDDRDTLLPGKPESTRARTLTGPAAAKLDDDQCTTLCILAVPSYLTPSDFLGFVGEKTREIVSHFRMIRTGRTNRYMVLMKFRSPKKAKQWRKEWNGKVFISTEPETCHVVFVKSIQFQAAGKTADPSSFPDITNDPFTPPISATHQATHAAETSLAPTTTLTVKPVAPPTPALIELPTCPVCLERMDETTGLLTILCQHVFHCDCLQKWRGSGCPVCRYEQGHALSAAHRVGGTVEDDLEERCCSVCRSETNLWICLLCGNVGCGRYDEAHAFSHYEESSHCYAMDLDTKRVWDYAGDGYVHRLIQNKSDGKLVELPSPDARTATQLEHDGLTCDAVPREKVDTIGMEYTHLLTSQLDSQRLYFEQKVAQAADKAGEASHAAEAAAATVQRVTEALDKLQHSYDTLVRETIPGLELDKSRAERKAEKSSETARRLEHEWKEEKAMNGSLMERIDYMSKEVETLKAKNADLEEQNRDLTFFISSQAKLDGLGEEVQEGTVVVGDGPKLGHKKKGKGKR